MRKLKLLVAIAGALGLASAVAVAGVKSNSPTYVNTSGTLYAYGALGSARSSSDANAVIGCYLTGGGAAGCHAANSVGGSLYCSIYPASQGQINALMTMTANSYIYFGCDSSNHLTYLEIDNNSDNLPATP